MKTNKEILIGAIGVLVISGLVLFVILFSFLMIMFSPMLAQAKEIAINQNQFFIWNSIWTVVSMGLMASAVGLILRKKWGRNLIMGFAFLALLVGFWGVWRTNKINFLFFIYYAAIPIYFGRKNIGKALS